MNDETEVLAAPESTTETVTGTPNADAAALKAEVEKLRKESAGYRTKLREAEKAAAASAPTIEQANARISDLENSLAKMSEGALSQSITAVATSLGFANPAIAEKLMDKDGLKADATADITTRLTEVLKANPYLSSKRSTDASAGVNSPSVSDPNGWLRSMLKQ